MKNELLVQLIKDKLDKDGQIALMVHGNSMFPTFHNNQIVKVKKSSNISIGNIIAYYLVVDGVLKIIVHRVIFKRKEYVLTRGDNNGFIDTVKVKNESIIGVVM